MILWDLDFFKRSLKFRKLSGKKLLKNFYKFGKGRRVMIRLLRYFTATKF